LNTETISILIPTYARPNFLTRLLEFIERSFSKLPHIYILDSTPPDSTNNFQFSDNLSNVVTHLKFPPSIGLVAKLASAINFVSTEYVAVCADDDFLLPLGTGEAKRFLDKNPDYGFCTGRVAVNEWTAEGLRVVLRIIYRHGLSLEDDCALVRVRKFLTTHSNQPLIYGLSRSAQLREVYKFATVCHTENPYVNILDEVFLGCATALIGKSKILDSLYAVRTPNTYPSNSALMHLAGQSRGDFTLAAELLAIMYSRYHGRDNGLAKTLFANALDEYKQLYTDFYATNVPPEARFGIVPFKEKPCFDETEISILQRTIEKYREKCSATELNLARESSNLVKKNLSGSVKS
jgi:glycosyltransferase domain-containing protein